MYNTLNGSLTPMTNLVGSLSSGGGSGGTSNYNDLSNKPSINGVTLSGDKTTLDLGLKFIDLEDVALSSTATGWLYRVGILTPGQPTRYEIETHSPVLNEISNVSFSNLQNGDVLAYDSNTSKWVNKTLYTDYEATLTAGNTTVTITNAAITGNETIDVYTNVFGVSPTNIVASSGSIVLTFPVQASNVSVKVRLS